MEIIYTCIYANGMTQVQIKIPQARPNQTPCGNAESVKNNGNYTQTKYQIHKKLNSFGMPAARSIQIRRVQLLNVFAWFV